MSYFGREVQAVYVISVAAQLAGMHPQTLREYERRGLVNPERTPGGSRRYSEADVHRIRRIQELTDGGLNLEGVRQVIALEEENDRLRADIAHLQRLLDETNRQYKRELVPFGLHKILLGQQRNA